MKKMIALASAATLVLGGCSGLKNPMNAQSWTTQETMTILAGGALGGYLAHAYLGAGVGNLIYTALGAAAGGAAGYTAYQTISKMDMRRAEAAAVAALDEAPNYQAVGWINEETGSSGAVIPTSTFILSDGTMCRDFAFSFTTKEMGAEKRGTACRMGDGAWVMAT
jgi:surface antigen